MPQQILRDRSGRWAAPAAQGIVLAFAGLVLLARPAGAEVIALRGPDGHCLLRQAPEGTHAQALAVLAQEAQSLEQYAARLGADAAAMRLAAAREQVPRFGDWAYGWVQSYVTSYRVLARGVVELARSAAGEEGESGASLSARLTEEMAGPIREEFRRTVLEPVTRDGGLAADMTHLGRLLDVAWGRAVESQGVALAALPAARRSDGALWLDLSTAARPLAPLLAAALPADPVSLLMAEGADTSTVFLRSMRPMAARLGAVLVRVSEAGSIVATGGAFGYALGGMPGTVAGVAGGVGISWAFDWLFNRVDAALNKGAFEAQALEAIARAERRVAEGAAEAARAALASRVAALSAPGDCK